MSVARQPFPDSIVRTLMMRGGVALGPLMPEDTGNLFLWTNDIETAGLDLPYRPIDGVAFANWLATAASDQSRVVFAIRAAGRAQAVGTLMLSGIHPVNRCADLGIRIGVEQDRGKGIGAAAVSLGLDYAWDHLNLMRVQLRVLADNERAIAAYRRAGFAAEGRHANAVYLGGAWHDMMTMAAVNPREAGNKAC
ncbi:MAG: GNAT family protein [Rhizomicrobium sp.]